jgi:hypothetical protein
VRFLAVAAVPLLPIACGSDGGPARAPVSGTVWYRGQPVARALVTFVPEARGARVASGSTDASGKYRLGTFGSGDGAVPGRHRVGIRAEAAPEGPPRAADDLKAKPGKLLTPARYANPETSDLTAEVEAGKNNVFDFRLED